MNLNDKLRASAVKRWHIVPTSIPQSLSDHMWNVAIIAVELAKEAKVNTSPDFFMYALTHDLPEVITGDIPTSFKSLAKTQLGVDLNKVGLGITGLDLKLSRWDVAIVKMADDIEAVWFIHQFGVGALAKQALAECEAKLETRLYTEENRWLMPAAKTIYAQVMDERFFI